MKISTPKIYAALDNHQENQQSTVVEVEGKIAKQYIYVLIDPWSTHSYVTPEVAKSCFLGKMKHNRYSLVQLATWTKKISEWSSDGMPHRIEWTCHESKFECLSIMILLCSYWYGLVGRA